MRNSVPRTLVPEPAPRLKLVGSGETGAGPAASIRPMQWLARLYTRRIINVNVNVVLSGVLALVPLSLTVHLATNILGLQHKLAISAITFFADITFDVLIYFILHWLANHSSLFSRFSDPAMMQPSFFRDATVVQFERAVLSPLLYAVALGLQALLIHRGVGPVYATIVSFSIGIAVSRVLHTIWMLKQERRAKTSPARA